MMQVAPSDLARELSNRPTVLLASAEFLASTEVPLRHLHRVYSYMGHIVLCVELKSR